MKTKIILNNTKSFYKMTLLSLPRVRDVTSNINIFPFKIGLIPFIPNTPAYSYDTLRITGLYCWVVACKLNKNIMRLNHSAFKKFGKIIPNLSSKTTLDDLYFMSCKNKICMYKLIESFYLQRITGFKLITINNFSCRDRC